MSRTCFLFKPNECHPENVRLEILENHGFSDVFMGYRKRPVAWNGSYCFLLWHYLP